MVRVKKLLNEMTNQWINHLVNKRSSKFAQNPVHTSNLRTLSWFEASKLIHQLISSISLATVTVEKSCQLIPGAIGPTTIGPTTIGRRTQPKSIINNAHSTDNEDWTQNRESGQQGIVESALRSCLDKPI